MTPVLTLKRLVALRGDRALMAQFHACVMHAAQLVAVDPDSTAAGLVEKRSDAITDARLLSEAAWLAIHEEARQPYVELLTLIDESTVLRARPHLEERLKELLR